MDDFMDERRLAGPRFADENDRVGRRAIENVEHIGDRLIEAIRPRQLACLRIGGQHGAELRERFEIDVVGKLIAEPFFQRRVSSVGKNTDALANLVQRLGRQPRQIERITAERGQVFFDGAGTGLLHASVDVLAEASQQLGERRAGRAAAERVADLAAHPGVLLRTQPFEQPRQECGPALRSPDGVLPDVDVEIGQQPLDRRIHLAPARPVLEVIAELLPHLDGRIARQLHECVKNARLGLSAARRGRRLAFDLVRRARKDGEHRRIAGGGSAQRINERPECVGAALGVLHQRDQVFGHERGIISGAVRGCQQDPASQLAKPTAKRGDLIIGSEIGGVYDRRPKPKPVSSPYWLLGTAAIETTRSMPSCAVSSPALLTSRRTALKSSSLLS